ncbi:MAG TPA: OmpA family protein [Saprospiraceae bacterium]|nr:OmpA family protein [Saprospiraceae bacterium]
MEKLKGINYISLILILSIEAGWPSIITGQRDTLYFFDFENVHSDFDSIKKNWTIYDHGGIFEDIQPVMPRGGAVVTTSWGQQTLDFAGSDVGKGFLYHSPSWYKKEFDGVSFNQIELALDAPLLSGKFYHIRFLTGNFRSHQYMLSHYGIKFSNERIIKKKPWDLLSRPDVFFDFSKENELEEVQAIFYAESNINYIYFGSFSEDSSRLLKKVIYKTESDNQSFADSVTHIHQIRPTRVVLDNILIEELKPERSSFRDIYFEVDRDEIQSPTDKAFIRTIVLYLKENPETFLLIQGYTDETGTFVHNLDLSKKRAESVSKILVRDGISADRIVTSGKGIYSEESAGNRKYARKISFMLFR